MIKINQIHLKKFTVLHNGCLLPFIKWQCSKEKSMFHKSLTGKPVITANIKALIDLTLKQPYDKLNTDWFGTIQAEAILRWAKKGYPEGTQYVEKWLSYHIEHDNKLSDEEYLNTYQWKQSQNYKGRSASVSLFMPAH